MNEQPDLYQDLQTRFPGVLLAQQPTRDGIPTFWVSPEKIKDVLRYLKTGIEKPYRMLYDLTAIDERTRCHREGQPSSDYTIVYHMISFDRNSDIRIKAPLPGDKPSISSVTDIWPSANWYEDEVWDMFGVDFPGHPHLRRILMPSNWQGHPLRKDHPARATEMEPYHLTPEQDLMDEERMRFNPEEWGMQKETEDAEFMFLNVGPQHPGTHGVFRIVLQLAGEEIIDAVPDIGYHHRAAEKMGERQSWHTFIPYTDRVDYLSGVMNNLPYVLSVEKLAGIEVPDRVKVIRIMTSELFRIINHLVYYGTYAQDIGQLSPVFYMFSDREKAFDIIEAFTGARMHPSWFRIGGIQADLPEGWEKLVRSFLDYLPRRLDHYDKMVMDNSIFKDRTIGVGQFSTNEAIEWGATGPMLRATGIPWDFRKIRPYGGYDQFEFDVATASHGDCYDRLVVHIEEMRQSLRIIEQCVKNMPPGPIKADHPVTTPPEKERTMHDIETLITHFLNVTWGPVVPPGEAIVPVEATKGNNGYYLISDGDVISYRTRIRTPSFPHLQMIPLMARGRLVSDLVAILGSIDFVMSDVDR